MTRPLKFTAEDSDAAHDVWGANCGPTALAAVAGMTLEQVRTHMIGFEQKRYTNPKMMMDALTSIKKFCFIDDWYCRRNLDRLPVLGLARIQWDGPWTNPGVPIKARYRKTHWVGSFINLEENQNYVFDVNSMSVGGWITKEIWSAHVVPYILQHCVPRANGKWHITHSIEVTQ